VCACVCGVCVCVCVCVCVVCVCVRVLHISNCDVPRSRFKVVFKNNMADIRTWEAGTRILYGLEIT